MFTTPAARPPYAPFAAPDAYPPPSLVPPAGGGSTTSSDDQPLIEVRVPDGVSPGQQIRVQAPGGRWCMAVVPPGLFPGMRFRVAMPPQQQAPPQPLPRPASMPKSMRIQPVDTTGDGIVDAVWVDDSGDGTLDHLKPARPVDTTGDGLMDAIGIDTTGDGVIDTTVVRYRQVAVTLPDDGSVQPGHTVQISAFGRPYSAVVPPGVSPGGLFHMRVPVLPSSTTLLPATLVGGQLQPPAVAASYGPPSQPQPSPSPSASASASASGRGSRQSRRSRSKDGQVDAPEDAAAVAAAAASAAAAAAAPMRLSSEQAGVTCVEQPPGEAVRAAFDLIDSDGDGALTRFELIKGCGRSEAVRTLLGLPAAIRKGDGSRAALNALFERLDQDRDGRVSRDEFARVFAPASEAAAVEATPVHGADRAAYRAMLIAQRQRRLELREADDATDALPREGPGRRLGSARRRRQEKAAQAAQAAQAVAGVANVPMGSSGVRSTRTAAERAVAAAPGGILENVRV